MRWCHVFIVMNSREKHFQLAIVLLHTYLYYFTKWFHEFFFASQVQDKNKKICNEVRRSIRQNIFNWPLLVFFYVSHVTIINFGTTYHSFRTPCNIRSWLPKTRKYFQISFKNLITIISSIILSLDVIFGPIPKLQEFLWGFVLWTHNL